MGEAFFTTNFEEELRTRNARGAVTGDRKVRADLVIFDRSGLIWAAHSESGKLRIGDNLKKQMSASEWQFVLDNSLKFSYERLLVETKQGMMLLFCNMSASMRIMIGVIFHAPTSAVLSHYSTRSVTSLIWFSPRVTSLMPRREAEEATEVKEIAELAFGAFMTAGVRKRLIRSAPDATAYLIDRACAMATLAGCRLDCRSGRSSVPLLWDFNADLYVSILICLVMFIKDTCPDGTFQMKIGDLDGRPYPVLRCEPNLGEAPLFANDRFSHSCLHLADCIAANYEILFECREQEDEDGRHVRIAFLPATKPVDRLCVKQPLKRFQYRGLVDPLERYRRINHAKWKTAEESSREPFRKKRNSKKL